MSKKALLILSFLSAASISATINQDSIPTQEEFDAWMDSPRGFLFGLNPREAFYKRLRPRIINDGPLVTLDKLGNIRGEYSVDLKQSDMRDILESMLGSDNFMSDVDMDQFAEKALQYCEENPRFKEIMTATFDKQSQPELYYSKNSCKNIAKLLLRARTNRLSRSFVPYNIINHRFGIQTKP